MAFPILPAMNTSDFRWAGCSPPHQQAFISATGSAADTGGLSSKPIHFWTHLPEDTLGPPGVHPMRLLPAPGANLRLRVVLLMLLTNKLSKIPMTSSLDSINLLEMSIWLRETLDFLLSKLVVCTMKRRRRHEMWEGIHSSPFSRSFPNPALWGFKGSLTSRHDLLNHWPSAMSLYCLPSLEVDGRS